MLAAILLGIVIFRLWKLFTERPLAGRIVSSGLSRGYTSSVDPGMGNSVDYEFRLHTYLTIETPRGKRRLRFEQKEGFYLYYYPGTYVCRLGGLPYPIRDPKRSCAPEGRKRRGGEACHDDLSEGYLCAACGYLNNRSPSVPCGRCGHSLIDPETLFREDEV